MMRVSLAALAYFGIVFAIGFVLGTARTLWLAPQVGPLPATALELPVMLAASWWAAGWLVRRFGLGGQGEALTAGVLAFAVLMAAELALVTALMGESAAQWLAGFRQPPALLGLAAQILFALMPWWRVRGRF